MMAKKQRKRTAYVLIDHELHRRIGTVTSDSGEAIVDYVTRLLRPLVNRDYLVVTRREQARIQEETRDTK